MQQLNKLYNKWQNETNKGYYKDGPNIEKRCIVIIWQSRFCFIRTRLTLYFLQYKI
jgi:hypothetical protein